MNHQFSLRFLKAAVLAAACVLIATPEAISEEGEALTIATVEIPPYVMRREDGSLYGVFIDLMESASEQSGIAVSFDVSNWPRAQIKAQHGEVDAIFPVIFTQERTSWLTYPEDPLMAFRFSIFVQDDNTVEFDGDLETLRGMTIGRLGKSKLHPRFTEAEESGIVTIEEIPSLDQLAIMVSRGRIDGFAIAHLMGLWAIERTGADNVVPLETPIGVSNIFLALSKKSGREKHWRKLLEAASFMDFSDGEALRRLLPSPEGAS